MITLPHNVIRSVGMNAHQHCLPHYCNSAYSRQVFRSFAGHSAMRSFISNTHVVSEGLN